MSSRRLDRIGIDPFLIEIFSKNGIFTAGDVLLMSPLTMMVCADLSMKDSKAIISKVSEKIHCKASSALDIFHKRATEKRFQQTGLVSLDTALKGGLPIGCISEISGPPGVGKTQFCLGCSLQTIAQSQLSNITLGVTAATKSNALVNGVVYIDTELKFDPNRLIQMAIETFPELYSSEYRTDAPHMIDKLLSCVKIIRPTTCKQLSEEIGQLQSVVISQGITLIVIDSIAALARKEALNEQEKEKYFINQASSLKKLAELCNCVVLATNQVTMSSSANPSSLYNDAILDEYGAVYQPALGPTWHHCVSTRLTMNTASSAASNANSSGDDSVNSGGSSGSGGKLKYVSITKSPIVGPHTIPFVICASGLKSPITNNTTVEGDNKNT